jgi:hypothetical protein
MWGMNMGDVSSRFLSKYLSVFPLWLWNTNPLNLLVVYVGNGAFAPDFLERLPRGVCVVYFPEEDTQAIYLCERQMVGATWAFIMTHYSTELSIKHELVKRILTK